MYKTDFEVRSVRHLAHARFFEQLSRLSEQLEREISEHTLWALSLDLDEAEAEHVARAEIEALMDRVFDAIEEE